jgi:acetoin utilization deacetylase AcuC-like enzyme
LIKTGFHIDDIYLRHVTPEGHPERTERMAVLLPLAARAKALGMSVIPAGRRAAPDELALAHDRDYVDAIASSAGRGVMLDADTFTSPESFDVASHAVGGVLDLVDRVIAGDLDNAFAAVRPPGHHAESDRAMGFCLFNTIAVAAAYAVARHSLGRVLIVDWDVHHGNGTQEIFWEDPHVLFVSLHQYPFYPGTGGAGEVGAGAGLGRTVNIPMTGGFGDAEYAAAFRSVVGPVARAFGPELVLVSAGFDAHVRDLLGGMRVTESGFDAMASDVLAIARECAGGRTIAVLEGGYDVGALQSCVARVLSRMQSTETAAKITDEGSFGPVMERVRSAHAAHWNL